MKFILYILSIILVIMSCRICFAQQASSKDSLVEQINSAWINSDYSAIKDILDERLSQDPEDIIANGIMQYYYFFVAADFAAAKKYAQRFQNLIQHSGKNHVSQIVSVYAQDIMAIDENANDGNPYSPDEMEAIRNCFPDSFPGIEFIIDMAGAILEE